MSSFARAILEGSIIELHPARTFDEQTDAWIKAGLSKTVHDLRLEKLFTQRPDIFSQTDYLLVYVDQWRTPSAVLGACWAHTRSGIEFLHISSQFIANGLRRTRVFVETWLALLERLAQQDCYPNIFALKTYNPTAYRVMRRYGAELLPGAIYPNVRSSVQPHGLTEVAKDIAAVLAPTAAFQPAVGRLVGVGQPADLYIVRPHSCDVAVDCYFQKHLRPSDRLLTIVCLEQPENGEAIRAILRNRSIQRQVQE